MKKNLSYNFLFTVLSTISTFIVMKLVFIYLMKDSDNYGLWLTIYSILSYIYLVDFGLSNGLRNLITPLVHNGNQKMNIYIANNMSIMFIICAGLLIIFNTTIYFLDVNIFNNLSGFKINLEEFKIFLILIGNLQIIYFGLSYYKSLFHAFSKTYLINFTQLLGNITIITLLAFLNYKGIKNNWSLLAIIFIGSQILSLIGCGLLLRVKENIKLKLSFDVKVIKELFSLSNRFLILQLSNLILFNSLPIIIGITISLTDASIFQLSYKILSMFLIITTIIIGPIWTTILNANSKGDLTSIKTITRRMNALTIILIFMCLGSSIFINFVIYIWMGKNFNVPLSTSFLIAFFVGLCIVCSIYQGILNGLNLFKTQIISYLFGAIFILVYSYVLSIFEIANLNYLMVGGIISLIFPSLFMILSYNNFINSKSKYKENVS